MTTKIAILGATSHIAKGFIHFFSKDSNFSISLFSRKPEKISEFLLKFKNKNVFDVNNLKNFPNNKFDVIINCIGITSTNNIDYSTKNIFDVTEKYDEIILDYLKNFPDSLYLNASSGAVFGKTFDKPVTCETLCNINPDSADFGGAYSVAKLYSECKHRAHNNFNIVDLRIFNYFSRYINLETKYLLSEIIKCVKNNTVFQTNSINIIRDYVHPYDLTELIKCCIKKHRINVALDVYSKAPIEKFLLIDWFVKEYGLKINIQKNVDKSSPTGIKINYYSKCKKAENYGYFPKYTSLETIKYETKKILTNL